MGLVDVGGRASGIARSREHRHHAVLPHERAHTTVGGEADPNDLSGTVDAECGRRPTAQIPEVPDPAVFPEDRVSGAVVAVAAADDLSPVVDVPGDAELVAGESSEVGHRSVLPEERVHETIRRETAAHDLARVVDAIRGAGMATEGAEVRHPAGAPQDGVTRRSRRRSEEHTSELQSQSNLVCRLLLEKKKKKEHEQPTNN